MKASEVLARYARGERDFQDVNLRGQSFRGKDLSGADFSRADIRGTNFKNAILQGTKFCEAKAGLILWKRYFLVIAMLILSALSGLCSVWAGVIATMLVDRSDIVSSITGTVSLLAIITFFIISCSKGIVYGLVPCAFLMIVAVSIGVIFNKDLVGAGAIAVAIEGTVAIAIASTVVKLVTETRKQENRVDWGIGVLTVVLALTQSIKPISETSDSAGIIISMIVASGITIVGIYISRKGVNGHENHNWVYPIALFLTRWGGTNFEKANLNEADFTDATLINSNFRKAKLLGTCWRNAKKLERAQLKDTILIQPAVRNLLITGQGEEKNYHDTDLRGANLSKANLKNANLNLADLSEATLEYANLDGANLTQVNAIGTNFTKASFTGACIEAWNIESSTILNDIDCRYVYLLEDPKIDKVYRERRPSSGEFQEGEFTKLFQELMDTVDLIFRNGVDWKAFITAFKTVQVENEDTELTIQSIENKGDGVVVVKVSVPPNTDKEKIHREFTEKYDIALKAIEEKYKAQLAAKDHEIIIYRQQNADMMEITKLLASKPINIPIINQPQNSNMSIINQTHSGSGDNVGGNKNINTYNSQNLAQAAAEIQQLLNQLSQTYPTNTTSEQMIVAAKAIEEIEGDPTLKQRVINAAKEGGLAAFEKVLDNPVGALITGVIKGWLDT